MFICDDLVILYVNLVNFVAVTPDSDIAKDVHPVVSFFKTNFYLKIHRADFHQMFTVW